MSVTPRRAMTMVCRSTTRAAATRGFRATAAASDVFKDKEMGEENIYFRREDKVLMEKLLKKMKSKEASELEKLKELIKPHTLPEDVLAAIVDWKHHD